MIKAFGISGWDFHCFVFVCLSSFSGQERCSFLNPQHQAQGLAPSSVWLPFFKETGKQTRREEKAQEVLGPEREVSLPNKQIERLAPTRCQWTSLLRSVLVESHRAALKGIFFSRCTFQNVHL